MSAAQANFDGNLPFRAAKGPNLKRPTSVGSYAARLSHPWGLCDMHGNVSEWCENTYDKENEKTRVFRGGSWFDDGASCRAAGMRFHAVPGQVHNRIGFRVCFRPE